MADIHRIDILCDFDIQFCDHKDVLIAEQWSADKTKILIAIQGQTRQLGVALGIGKLLVLRDWINTAIDALEQED